ncbi:nuclear transport factor 2 family protein [Streptomyces olivoreticuli]|uniref:nuclear transport factor 2 family protein n=1 Tax=Streptomyces olivoreticuli TaxID=68246 RepID=UPI000E22F899|nr:nuclear transport factor 2 family protein [Streptomyces olivoreticuli]
MNEFTRKRRALEHSRRINAGDVDAVVELYAPDAVLEDPVGLPPISGHEALRAHYGSLLAAHVREEAAEPVAGQDGTHVLLQVTSVMDYLPAGPLHAERGRLKAPDDPRTARLRRTAMLVMRLDEAGLIRHVKSYWGTSDLTVLD